MTGFLSAYEGTERIDLGRGYWAEVKKCLSSKEMTDFEAAMGGRQQVNLSSGQQFARIDVRAGRTELVVASLVAWNLDDEDGTPWPLDPEKPPYKPGCGRRQSVDRLPGPVFDRIWKRCDVLNGQEDTEARVGFPDATVGSDPDGDAGAADPASVSAGAGDVAEVWSEPGDAG